MLEKLAELEAPVRLVAVGAVGVGVGTGFVGPVCLGAELSEAVAGAGGIATGAGNGAGLSEAVAGTGSGGAVELCDREGPLQLDTLTRIHIPSISQCPATPQA